jgi:hypothetical protein
MATSSVCAQQFCLANQRQLCLSSGECPSGVCLPYEVKVGFAAQPVIWRLCKSTMP